MIQRLIKIIILLSFFFPFPALATTYYLTATGAGSKDGSSLENSFDVAAHNAASFLGDDVILLYDDGGTFTSTIIPPSSGTANHPITYTAGIGETPVIDRSLTFTGASGWSGPDGNGVYNRTITPGTGAYYASEDAIPLRGCNGEYGSNTCVPTEGGRTNDWYFVMDTGVMYYKPTDGALTHTVRTMWSTDYGMDIRDRSYLDISGITFNNLWYGILGGQVNGSSSSVSNVKIHGNTFYRVYWAYYGEAKNGTPGVSDMEIYNNSISYCNSGISQWASGSGAYNARILIHNNTITHHFSYATDDSVPWTPGFRVENYFTDHEGISFQDVQDSQVYNNSVTASYASSLILGDADYYTRAYYIFIKNSGVKISGNSFLRNYASGLFIQSFYISGYGGGGIENNVFAYNIIRNNHATLHGDAFGFFIQTSDSAAGVMNYWVNNTIYGSAYGEYVAVKCPGSWTFANNISYMGTGNHVLLDSHACNDSLTFSNNIYYGGAGFQLDDSPQTWTQWKALGTLYDTTGSTLGTDPAFLNGSGNYSLATDFEIPVSSPAKWAGVNLSLTADYAGNTPNNPPSIGAYEYGNEPPNPKFQGTGVSGVRIP